MYPKRTRREVPTASSTFASLAVVLFALLLGAGGFGQAQAPSTSAAAGANIWWKHAVVYEIYPRSFQNTCRNLAWMRSGSLPCIPRHRSTSATTSPTTKP
jgi:hypothetical protein